MVDYMWTVIFLFLFRINVIGFLRPKKCDRLSSYFVVSASQIKSRVFFFFSFTIKNHEPGGLEPHREHNAWLTFHNLLLISCFIKTTSNFMFHIINIKARLCWIKLYSSILICNILLISCFVKTKKNP